MLQVLSSQDQGHDQTTYKAQVRSYREGWDGGANAPLKSRLAPRACSWVYVHRCIHVEIRPFQVKNMCKNAPECIFLITAREGIVKINLLPESSPETRPRALSSHTAQRGYACVRRVFSPWIMAATLGTVSWLRCLTDHTSLSTRILLSSFTLYFFY